MGVVSGQLRYGPKIFHFCNLPPVCQFYRKVVLRLNEHDGVIETQTITLYLCNRHNNMHITQRLPHPKFSNKVDT